ncbi:MAG: endonuclease MutS2 [Symbiobacteriaceae bacterium]|nr:endonuclease MutS2 [Symbiobacteriaceae bacterium]
MDQKALNVLEYTKVTNMLRDYTASSLGTSLIEEMAPSADRETVVRWQQETTEAVRLLRSGASILGGLHDVRQEVKRAELGSILDPTDLLAIASTLQVCRRVKRWFGDHPDDYTVLHDVVLNIIPHREIEDAVAATIDDKGSIYDSASADLKRIRREMLSFQSRIRERLENMVRNPNVQKHLQDPIVTIRGERFVLPVRLESRAAVPGLIHDTSGSGATLFIEPMAVVELNNDLRRLQGEEREEVARILRELSLKVAAVATTIQVSLYGLGQLDLIFARGHLSLAMSAVEPEITQDLVVDLRRAKHPLLKGEVVPIDLELGQKFHILLITGPNTGGKTVSLKTVGLLQLMAQSGLHVPAAHGSRVALFDNIFADIGDEQSIEQSLSTFSSHMTNIVHIIKELTPRSLVLFDELGAGTDPAEGAALAMALMDHLLADQVRAVATTHYSDLKAFAYSREGIENGCVEFDVETLRPTYKLLIGIPGHSNAFEISRRLGLPETLINAAKGMVGSDQLAVEDLISSLEENHRYSQEARMEADQLRNEMARLKGEMDKDRDTTRERNRTVLRQAQSEAAALVARARQEAEELLAEIRALKTEATEREITQAAERARSGLRGISQRVGTLGGIDRDLLSGEAADILDMNVGDTVWLRRYECEGIILAPLNEKGELPVQAGAMKLSVPLDEVGLLNRQARRSRRAGDISEVQRAAAASNRELVQAKSDVVKIELDLRGQTLDEAIEAVAKFLDDSYLGNYPKVRIIHGRGTGVLRRGVREYLRKHLHVKSYEFAPYYEGGDGVTVVELK